MYSIFIYTVNMIIPINFSNIYHKKAILSLAKRNDFWSTDTALLLDLASPEQTKLFDLLTKLAKTGNPLYKRPLFEQDDYYGYFYVQERNGKKKIIAYMIFFDDDQCKLSTVHFLLVDKDYRSQGISKALVSHYIEEHKKQKYYMSIVKDAEYPAYWQKYGYIQDPIICSEVSNHTRMICPFELLTQEMV